MLQLFGREDSEVLGKGRSSVGLVLVMLFSFLSALIPPTDASEIVLTDAINIVNSGGSDDRMIALDADSSGNIHVVWSRNTQHLS